MALVWTGSGFLVDSSTGQVQVTYDMAGAKWVGGFLRAPDGKLVVRYA